MQKKQESDQRIMKSQLLGKPPLVLFWDL